MCGQNKNLIYEIITLKTQYNEGFLIKCVLRLSRQVACLEYQAGAIVKHSVR